MGLVDASEATDTYGSAFNDVRGFVVGGWPRMAVQPGAEDPLVPPELRGGAAAADCEERACPDLTSFMQDFVPTLTPADCVIVLWLDGADVGEVAAADAASLRIAAAAAAAAGAAVRLVAVRGSGAAASPGALTPTSCNLAAADCVELEVPSLVMSAATALPASAGGGPECDAGVEGSLGAPVLGLLALKLALNALTTGAHVARGAVVGNLMVNMMLTNHKLFLRAVGIVDALARCGAAAARRAVLRAAYALDDEAAVDALLARERADAAAVHEHVARAAVAPAVIPTALLLAAPPPPRAVRRATVADARAALAAEPSVLRAAAVLRAAIEVRA